VQVFCFVFALLYYAKLHDYSLSLKISEVAGIMCVDLFGLYFTDEYQL